MENLPETLANNIRALTYYINLNYIDRILTDESYAEEPQRFLYTILYKLNNGLSSCDYYILNFNSGERHLESLFLILRTLLSDSVMCLYVIQKGNKTDEELNSNIMSLYFDHFEYTLRNMKKYGQSLFNLSQEQIAIEIEDIKKKYVQFFDENGTEKYKALHVNIGQAVNYLVSNNSGGVRKMYIRAFDLYDQFSKLEHLGILSFQLMHRQYDTNKKPYLLKDIIDAINIVVDVIKVCLQGWLDLNAINDAKLTTLSGHLHTNLNQINSILDKINKDKNN